MGVVTPELHKQNGSSRELLAFCEDKEAQSVAGKLFFLMPLQKGGKGLVT
jgi:hypothetical protein